MDKSSSLRGVARSAFCGPRIHRTHIYTWLYWQPGRWVARMHCGLALYWQRMQHMCGVMTSVRVPIYRFACRYTLWVLIRVLSQQRTDFFKGLGSLQMPSPSPCAPFGAGNAGELPEGYFEDDVDVLGAVAACCSGATSDSDSESQSGSIASGSSADVQPRRQLHLAGSETPDTRQVHRPVWMRANSVYV